MSIEIDQFQDVGPDVDESPLLPDPSERQRPVPFERFHRWIGGALLAATIVTGGVNAAEHPEAAAIGMAHMAAESIYEFTPVGWAAQAFDGYMGDNAGWEHPTYTEFKIYHSDEHPTPRHPLVTNFIFTGLREMHGEEIAREISYATDHQYPVRYQENGNQPITADYMAEQLIESIKEHPLDTPYIGFTCHSMGGIMLIETLDHLQQMGYKLPKIAFIDFLSTPSGMQTARFGGVGDFLTKAQIGQSATGEVVADIFSQMQAQSFDPSWYAHDITNAIDQLPDTASPALTDSQMKALDQVDSLPTLIADLERLKGIISKDTKFRYYGPTNPNTDGVVRDFAAHDQLAYAVHKVFGATMPYIGWGQGHARTDFGTNPQASSALRQGEEPSAAMAGNTTPGLSPSSLNGLAADRS
jgi:hypothetical protein